VAHVGGAGGVSAVGLPGGGEVIDKAKVWKLYQAGVKPKHIAERLGYTLPYVDTICKQLREEHGEEIEPANCLYCTQPPKALGLCNKHWERWYKRRPMEIEPIAKGWVHHGYRYVMAEDGREVLESRYLMEQQLGRQLDVDECVHHKNGITTDNSLENLEIVPRASHTRRHLTKPLVARICPICGIQYFRKQWRHRRAMTCSKICGTQRAWETRRIASAHKA
jgi:hypothetical protein